jgi:hypothetical protein
MSSTFPLPGRDIAAGLRWCFGRIPGSVRGKEGPRIATIQRLRIATSFRFGRRLEPTMSEARAKNQSARAAIVTA